MEIVGKVVNCESSVVMIVMEKTWCKTIENWMNRLVREGFFSSHKQIISGKHYV